MWLKKSFLLFLPFLPSVFIEVKLTAERPCRQHECDTFPGACGSSLVGVLEYAVAEKGWKSSAIPLILDLVKTLLN